tara:strand:+ start:443 stop:856 length:414 start_codon:yes stop_codon:yes gene_type:complete
MANTFTAPFAQTPKISTGVLTAAGTSVDDDPTNSVLIATAGGDGALLTSLTCIPRVTVTASRINLFVSGDSGSTKRLVSSVLMEAQTVNTTTVTAQTVFTEITETTPMRLEAAERIYMNSAVALSDGIVCTAETTDF